MPRAELLSRFNVPLTRECVPPSVIVDELVAAVDGGLTGSATGRFFAWVIGGSLPSAVATEWLMSAWYQNAANYATSPVSSVVEAVAGKWLLDVLRLPPEASFGFTTGCQMAHFTALSACSQHLYQQPPTFAEKGVSIAPELEAVVQACLEKNPTLRPQTAVELRSQLEACGIESWGRRSGIEWWRDFPPDTDQPAPATTAEAITIAVDAVRR